MMHVGMGVGLVAGLAFGLLAAMTGSPVLLAIAEGVRPLGTAFVNAIQMVVIPLVMSVVFVGVARLGDLKKVGRTGGLAIGFFWLTTIPAILLGMGLMKVGLRFAPDVTPPTTIDQVSPELPGIVDFLLRLIPRNPFEAAADGALLPLIVFTILLAAAAGTLDEDKRERLVGLADALSAALIKLVHWILLTGIVGIFGLVAPVTATTGWEVLQSLAVFVLTVIVGLFVFVSGVYLPAVAVLGRMNPIHFLRSTAGTQIVGFTTTSSVATLPVMLDEADAKLRVDPSVAHLVLPLGASLNRAGSALFQGAAVIFVAFLYGVPVPTVALGGAVLATFFASITVAPVPSASIMTLAPALDSVGAPLAGLGVLLGIDRIPDMFRSAVNMIGHMAGTVVVQARTASSKSDNRPSG
jgi:Na+/H+-dicarboxylate symporter